MTKPAIGAKVPSSAKAGSRGQSARVASCPAERPAQVRNVALIGRSGVGKTTLVEHLLAFAGAIGRAGSVADGTTVSDSDPIEVSQQRSVFLSACPLTWRGTLVNLLDTPGFADFVGEVRAGLRAADSALFVVAATDPLDEATLALWQECTALGLPRAVLVNRLDLPRADFDATVAAVRRAFDGIGDSTVVPLAQPASENTALLGLLDPPEHPGQAMEHRRALIEAIIGESEDESLLEDYLAGHELDPQVLRADLHTALSRGQLHPVLPVCAATELGMAELLNLVVDALPSPIERPTPRAWTPIGGAGPDLACDPAGPLAAEVVRTWADPYVGRVSMVRVFSGTLRGDSALHIVGRGSQCGGHADHELDEKPASLLGVGSGPIDHVVAGNLCLVARLTGAETGDTLCEPAHPLVVLPWMLPAPLLPIAVAASTRNDEDHLARALNRLIGTDPAVQLERNADTGQLVVWCLGEAHADMVLSRLREGGAAVTVEPVRVALRATFARSADGHGRHVKQSGGHGQYGVCTITVDPLPRGSGVEFLDRVVGGAVPNQFISSVEKGVRRQLGQGIAASIPIDDVRVTLADGKAHHVDSSDAAFQLAGALAVKAAAATAGLQILEPVDSVDILIGDQHIGAVLSDLSGRRGRVTRTEQVNSDQPGSVGHSVIYAEVPAIELVGYAPLLRALTGGSGTFTRAYLRHDPAPDSFAP